jgi:tetratricopeptide (TPR) repeat protein
MAVIEEFSAAASVSAASAEVVISESPGASPDSSPAERDLTVRLLNLLIFLVLLLLPLFFLPLTAEYYETNKQALLALIVIPGLSLLFYQGAGRGYLIGSRFDKVLGLLLAVALLSTVFSISASTSFFGHFGRLHGGLLSLFWYLGLFYLTLNAVNSFTQIKRLVFGAALAVNLLAVLAVLQTFKLYLLPFAFARLRSWTPMGSPTALLYLIALTLPLTLSLAATTVKILRPLFFGGLLLQLLLLGIWENPPAWFLAALGLIVFVVLSLSRPRRALKSSLGWGRLGLVVVALLLSLGLNIGSLRPRLLPPRFAFAAPPAEVVLSPRVSWSVAREALKDRPFLGNGPETFIFNYSRFKPAAMNVTPFWDLRFDRPFDQIFYLLSTLGLAGLAVYSWLWFVSLKTAFSARRQVADYPLQDQLLTAGLSAALLAFIAHLFLYYTTTATSAFFWIILAMLTVAAEGRRVRPLPRSLTFRGRLNFPVWLRAGSVIFLLASSFLYFGRSYRAQLEYAAGLRAFAANQAQPALRNMSRAARDNPARDTYLTGLSTVSLAVAQALGRGQGQGADQEKISLFIQQGINAAQEARRLNPANVQNWEHLAGYYRTIASLASGADKWALTGFANAVRLDPANPRLRENLGSFYFDLGRYREAEQSFQLALKLKPDYVLARYNLSRVYRKQERFDEARKELEKVLSDLPEDNPARASLEAQIKDLDRLASGKADKAAAAKKAESGEKGRETTPGSSGSSSGGRREQGEGQIPALLSPPRVQKQVEGQGGFLPPLPPLSGDQPIATPSASTF